MRERSLVFYANFKQSNLPFFYQTGFLNGPGLPKLQTVPDRGKPQNCIT